MDIVFELYKTADLDNTEGLRRRKKLPKSFCCCFPSVLKQINVLFCLFCKKVLTRDPRDTVKTRNRGKFPGSLVTGPP